MDNLPFNNGAIVDRAFPRDTCTLIYQFPYFCWECAAEGDSDLAVATGP